MALCVFVLIASEFMSVSRSAIVHSSRGWGLHDL
jgi:hypothetical protein